MTRVAIFFQMFGPYILARLNAAGRVCDLIGIEGSRRSNTYAWEPQSGGERFERWTLFTDRAIEDVNPHEIAVAVRRELDAIDPDVLVVSGWSQPDALAMLLWARDHDRHTIVMSESNAFDGHRTILREAIKRRVVRQFDAAMVGGQPQEDYVVSLGMNRERVFRGYNIVDNAFFERGAEAARNNAERVREKLALPQAYFLASSRFIEKKNLARLIEAFALYHARAGDDAWHLVLVGDGPLRAGLEQQAVQAGVADFVQFAGFRQYEDLPSYYGLAGAFCHVSTVEQWGLVVNEAMASGLPVMVSRNCGCEADLVVEGSNGWSVDPLDVGQMADRMMRLASDPAELQRMGQASRCAIERFHPAAFADGLGAALEVLTNSPRKHLTWFDRWLIRTLAARSAPTGR